MLRKTTAMTDDRTELQASKLKSVYPKDATFVLYIMKINKQTYIVTFHSSKPMHYSLSHGSPTAAYISSTSYQILSTQLCPLDPLGNARIQN